jgi:hypothetical protein
MPRVGELALLHDQTHQVGAAATLQLLRWDGHTAADQLNLPIQIADQQVDFAGTTWTIRCDDQAGPGGVGRTLVVHATPAEPVDAVTLAIVVQLSEWSRDAYVLMPAAAYNGNRLRRHHTHRMEGLGDLGLDPVPIMGPNPQRLLPEGDEPTDVYDGRLNMLSGDLSQPAIAIHLPDRDAGLMLITEHRGRHGYTGLRFTEDLDAATASARLMSPGVREGGRPKDRPLTEAPADLAADESLVLRVFVQAFDAPNLQAIYDQLLDRRTVLESPRPRHEELPFSEAWRLLETQMNLTKWVQKYGYFSVGMRESPPQDWQTAWVGGVNAMYPLLASGDTVTQSRAKRTFAHIRSGVAPNGLLRGVFHEGTWNDRGRLFQRHNADGLYFLVRALMLLEARGQVVADEDRQMVRTLAVALCDIWDRHGQLGHYADIDERQLKIGRTCAASTAPAGLALASQYFDIARYLDVAQAAATQYRDDYLAEGFTNAGPGDIIQAPDSESCAGLLESFVTLMEVTGDTQWRDAAADAAAQCATWVVPYDFDFPEASTHGRLRMRTTGTVFANVQNKHSSPGLCTLSGASLWRLFRATGDRRYLDLAVDITHAIPQFMSREDRPILDIRPGMPWPVLPPGWINERVNMSDWEVRGEPGEIGVGELFGGSCWPESTMMLVWTQMPGVYAQPDTGLLAVADHLTAAWLAPTPAPGNRNGETPARTLALTNPTQFDATTKLFTETSTAASKPVGPLPPHTESVRVPAGKTVAAEVKCEM